MQLNGFGDSVIDMLRNLNVSDVVKAKADADYQARAQKAAIATGRPVTDFVYNPAATTPVQSESELYARYAPPGSGAADSSVLPMVIIGGALLYYATRRRGRG